MWRSLSQLFGNLFQCNSHSKSDNIPVTPQKCPGSAGFHIQENEESRYEVCHISIETVLVPSNLHFQSNLKYSKLIIINIFFASLFYGQTFILVPFKTTLSKQF